MLIVKEVMLAYQIRLMEKKLLYGWQKIIAKLLQKLK